MVTLDADGRNWYVARAGETDTYGPFNESAARDMAERMAAQFPATVFYLLRPVASVERVSPVKWTDFQPPSPF